MAKKDGDKEVKKAADIAEEKSEKINSEDEVKKDEEVSKENEEEKVENTGYNFKLTFAAYLSMLGTTGWQALGKLPNPVNGKIEVNLIQAKEVIDLLEILENKTKGNLTSDEDNILKTTLSNLRINYVEELKKTSGGKN